MATDINKLIVTEESPHEKECLDLLMQLHAELSEKYPDELKDAPLVPENWPLRAPLF